MIGTVVVPLDRSDLAEKALVYARPIARRSGALLLLIHVIGDGANEPETEESREYLRSVASRQPGQVRVEVLRGHPADAIVNTAREASDPIIVMSSHGRSGVHWWVTGSTADKVLRTASCPVLLVRVGEEIPEKPGLRSILVALDRSEQSEAALSYATEMARLFESEVHLVHVVDTPSVYAMLGYHVELVVTDGVLDDILESMRRESRNYLQQIAVWLTERGIDAKPVVLEGYPGKQLIEYERSGSFELVVMAASARAGVSRLVLGSVVELVLRLGRAPLMIVPPNGNSETDSAMDD